MSIKLFLSGLLLLSILMVGCSSTVRYSSQNSVKNTAQPSTSGFTLTDQRLVIVQNARKYIGTPYCYGGEGMSCFDCSGFVNLVYKQAGVSLPRVSRDIYTLGQFVDLSKAQPGDLVFFKKNGTINHVGIYIGNNHMIHASTSRGVIEQDLNDSYYRQRLAGVKSILK